jgi:hypothetical protein
MASKDRRGKVAVSNKIAISHEVYRPVVRLIIGLIILAIINWILTNLPMIQQLQIPWLPITIRAIISAVIGIIMIALFITFRQDFVPRLDTAMPTFQEAGTIVASAVGIGIISIAYVMFDDVILPFMGRFSWIYPVVFLVIAIWPLITLVVTLYRSSDKIADLITGKIAQASGELVKCGNCGKTIPSSAKYCPRCSAQLSLFVTESGTIKCRKCGAENKAENRYCLECGRPLHVSVSKKT